MDKIMKADGTGKKIAVILDISTFENLLESLEDLYFGLKAEQALDEGEYIDFDEANKRPSFSKTRICIHS